MWFSSAVDLNRAVLRPPTGDAPGSRAESERADGRARRYKSRERRPGGRFASMILIIIIVVLVVLALGGFGFSRRR